MGMWDCHGFTIHSTSKVPCFFQQVNKERGRLAISPEGKSSMGWLPEGSRSNGLLLSDRTYINANGKLSGNFLQWTVSSLQVDHHVCIHSTWRTVELNKYLMKTSLCQLSFLHVAPSFSFSLLSLTLSLGHVDVCDYNIPAM